MFWHLAGGSGKNAHISMISNSVTHLRSYPNTITARNSMLVGHIRKYTAFCLSSQFVGIVRKNNN